jgi:hypothetical protein
VKEFTTGETGTRKNQSEPINTIRPFVDTPTNPDDARPGDVIDYLVNVP